MKIHRDRRGDAAGRQRTARRFAVGRRGRLPASNTLVGLPDPPGGALLVSRPLRPITTTSGRECRPSHQVEGGKARRRSLGFCFGLAGVWR